MLVLSLVPYVDSSCSSIKLMREFLLPLIFISILFGVERLQAEELKVCVDPYPPFKIVDSAGKVSGGIDIHLIRTLTEAMGVKAVYTTAPWARCLANLKNGRSDFVSGIRKSKEREEYLHYIEPPYKTRSVKVFYVNKGDEARFQTFDDLQKSTVGILRKAKYFEEFDSDDGITKYEVSDEVLGFKMLQLNRIDAFLTTEEVGDYILEQNDLTDLFSKAEYKYNQEVKVYFALSKKSSLATRLTDFSSWTKELSENGSFELKDGAHLNYMLQ